MHNRLYQNIKLQFAAGIVANENPSLEFILNTSLLKAVKSIKTKQTYWTSYKNEVNILLLQKLLKVLKCFKLSSPIFKKTRCII